MKLKRLGLTNFQGVGNFVLDANLKDCEIRGANAAGKTTIFSAFCFLLYGLDSQGKTFLPKPIDGSGEPKHGISSEAEAIFLLNGDNEITLKKEFKELWVKKHGSPKKVFTGHTVKHFWDSVPISEKEYKKRLSEIAPEQVFKLLTSTRYFSEGLHWQDRRAILLDICGDMSDADIIASNKNLSRIPEILDGKSLEDQKKIITAQKTKLNKELSELPIRIDETTKGQPDITSLDLSIIEKDLSEISEALALKNQEALRIESGGEIAEKIKKQRTIESELLEIENKISVARNWAEAERRKKVSEAEAIQRKKLSSLEKDLDAEMSVHAKTRIAIKDREADNKVAEQEMAKLRKEWHFINGKVFDENATVCPTCGQEYPSDQAEKIREKFHVDKAEALRKIDENGRTTGNGITGRKDLNEIDQDEVRLYEEKIEELAEQISEAKAQASEPEKETEKKKPFKNKEQETLELDLTEIKLSIEGLRANSYEAKEIVESEIAALTGRQEDINLNKQTFETHKKGEIRIAELSASQKMVAVEYENLEADLYVMDLFIRVKVSMLEGKVNKKFNLAEFKLFNILVNGALEEVCEVTYQGIPWNAGLNSSMQIRLGLDIIDTLGEFYGLQLPVFVDNFESITDLPESKSQIIKLIVDGNYDQLTVKND